MKEFNQLSSLILFCCLFLACSQGKWKEVKDENNNLVQKFMLDKEGQKDGVFEAYYSNGKIKESSFYKHGQLHGLRKLFYENGNIEIEENYSNNQLSGEYKNYDEKGQLILLANFSEGAMEGILTKYSPSGVKVEEVTFHNNEENGPFKEYYSNGQLHWSGEYLNGDNEFGELLEYDESGVLLKKMMCDSLAVCRTIWTKEEGDVVPKY